MMNVINFGVLFAKTKQRVTYTRNTNRVLLGLFGISIFTGSGILLTERWGIATMACYTVCTLCVLLLFFNKLGFVNFARYVISIALPIIVITVSVLSKQERRSVEPYEYFQYRFILLLCLIVPLYIFSARKIHWLHFALLPSFVLLGLFDFIHSFYGVGGFDMTTNSANLYVNYVCLVVYLVFAYAVTTQKINNESLQREKDILLVKQEELSTDLREINAFLSKQNLELQEKNDEIQTQNEEIISQNEEIAVREDSLRLALQTIERQKEQLIALNIDLENDLKIKNSLLEDTNKELVKYNNELRQFSYTVSHNLRGPLASLSGLINILVKDRNDDSLIPHVKKSIRSLEDVIKDLANIIDIRNEIYGIKEKIVLQDVCEQITSLIKKDLDDNKVVLNCDFSRSHFIYSIRPMVFSILYNLISNSIKYRSPERTPEIVLTSEVRDGYTILTIRDNGIGIDLTLYKDKIFGLYKRFHTHTTGKGLGLYLVKMQVEALGGRIEVTSEPGRSTQFNIFIKIVEDAFQQIYFENEVTKLYSMQAYKAAGIVWKKMPTSSEYRMTFEKFLEAHLNNPLTNWIFDCRNQGNVSDEDHTWMLNNILPSAMEGGLRQIVCIIASSFGEDHYKNVLMDTPLLKQNNIIIKYFTMNETALNWLRNENSDQLSLY